MFKKKKLTIGIIALVFILISGFALQKKAEKNSNAEIDANQVETRDVQRVEPLEPAEQLIERGYKNALYQIGDQYVQLRDGYAETNIPGSDAKVVTRVFGNEIVTDLDGDEDQDVAFIVTQETGGSGTFYYAVAALRTPEGYIGSYGYLLGDRIAPQSTALSQNPDHKFVVTFNYADRDPSEPMTAKPTVGKTAYLKITPNTNQWEEVESGIEEI